MGPNRFDTRLQRAQESLCAAGADWLLVPAAAEALREECPDLESGRRLNQIACDLRVPRLRS